MQQANTLLEGTETEVLRPQQWLPHQQCGVACEQCCPAGSNQATSTTAHLMLAVMQLQAHTERNAGLTGVAGAQHSVLAAAPLACKPKQAAMPPPRLICCLPLLDNVCSTSPCALQLIPRACADLV